MGKITNKTNQDLIGDVSVVGFATESEAWEYVEKGFKGGKPTFIRELNPQQAVEFKGNPYVVFWDIAPDTSSRLLSLTKCYNTLSLDIKNIGNQFLLVGAF